MRKNTFYTLLGWAGIGFMIGVIVFYLKWHTPWWAFITPFFGFIASFSLLVSVFMRNKNTYVADRMLGIGGILYMLMVIGAVCNMIFLG